MSPNAQKLLFFALVGFGCAITHGAAPPFQWVKTINVSATPTSLAADGVGNCYAAFNSEANVLDLGLGSLTGRCVVAKFAGDGRLIWNRVLEPSKPLTGELAVDSRGNCVFAGAVGASRQYFARLTPDGELIASREFAGSSYIGGVKLLENGEYLIANGSNIS